MHIYWAPNTNQLCCVCIARRLRCKRRKCVSDEPHQGNHIIWRASNSLSFHSMRSMKRIWSNVSVSVLCRRMKWMLCIVANAINNTITSLMLLHLVTIITSSSQSMNRSTNDGIVLECNFARQQFIDSGREMGFWCGRRTTWQYHLSQTTRQIYTTSNDIHCHSRWRWLAGLVFFPLSMESTCCARGGPAGTTRSYYDATVERITIKWTCGVRKRECEWWRHAECILHRPPLGSLTIHQAAAPAPHTITWPDYIPLFTIAVAVTISVNFLSFLCSAFFFVFAFCRVVCVEQHFTSVSSVSLYSILLLLQSFNRL